ncbi:Type 4 fimbrial assembly, ATPase PilB [Desulfurella amilsii]|uniref:Type 4 fimbrial assembly, ATPase PilB n=1 Tax=Desulfurella amilsii TaxID=1562698 RepID=A0A1X4XWI2_9BACT|nr:type IV-A pilus assembly ATPase PilB [Desulfurella amilsii]OSS41900.1 Type 4 fimbrial assembly, ATPase PilB [Desulfurella amilsii]
MVTTSRQLLGTMLLYENKITQEQLDKALQKQAQTGEMLGKILIEEHLVTEDELVEFLSKKYGIETTDLSKIQPQKEAINSIPSEVARKHRVFPFSIENNTLKVALCSVENVFLIDELRFLTGKKISIYLVKESQINEYLIRYYGTSKELEVLVRNVTESIDSLDNSIEQIESLDFDETSNIDDAPIIKLANSILESAVKEGASDIHLEPYENTFRVRFRIDGKAKTVNTPPKTIAPNLITRFKIMAKLNIAEKRLPQDGRIRIRAFGKLIDLRVSTVPTVFGEKLVMRLLDRENIKVSLDNINMRPTDLQRFKHAISLPNGVVIVTGPTGSGKSTTLYAALNELNKEDRNIMSVEDPVEYNLEGINQVQVKEDIGLTFSSVLRSFLRQDPDIIMVGEIRDTQTAEIAVRAALTGHLVLSTLHTNDSVSAITRLIDMGIDGYLIASSLRLVLAQRLVRKICTHCRQPINLPKEILLKAGFDKADLDDIRLFKGKGCSHCLDTGYKGRMAIFEVLHISEDIREMIIENKDENTIRQKALQEGMLTLKQDGLQKVKQGITTLEEVLSAAIN